MTLWCDGIAVNVLKDSSPDGESKILQEAEKVVEKYMGKKPEKKRTGHKKRSPSWWVSIVSFGLGMLATKLFV